MRRVRKCANVQSDVLKLVVRREGMGPGSIQLSRDWLDLNALIIEVVEHMRPSLGQRDIRLHLAHVLPLLQGDRDKLAQVIAYLLNNAIAYEPHNGKICISSYVDGPMVHVRVQQYGCSIPYHAT